MSQQRLARLGQWLQIKEKRTQEAVQDWQQAKHRYDAAKIRHDQLLGYRNDYMQQLQQLGDSGCQAARIRNRLNFIGQLDAALLQMSQQLAGFAKQRSECEQNFIQAKAQQDVVLKLIDKVKVHQQERMARMLQKESDEYAQKQWYSNNLNQTTHKPRD